MLFSSILKSYSDSSVISELPMGISKSTNMMIAGLSSVLRILMLSLSGLLTLELLVDAMALLPLTILAAMAGTHFFKASSPERFFQALQRMMLLAAVLLAVKGVAVRRRGDHGPFEVLESDPANAERTVLRRQ